MLASAYSYQIEPSGYIATLAANLCATLSARGLLLNVLPVAVLTGVAGLGWRHAAPRLANTPFRPVDLLVIPGLVVVALVLTQMFQIGRIVMHAAPLYVIPGAVALGRWMDADSRVRLSPAPDVATDV
jgi:hypothetical protein